MPETVTVLKVFVSSPSDLTEDRKSLDEVVRELNRSTVRQYSIRLELIKWESDAVPGFGTDAQEVVNRQIPDDYDVFLGIMWARYGTETSRSGSGTEEEFSQAYDRHSRQPSSIRILFYFKDAPLRPSEIDPEQLGRVQDFKKKVSERGGLYAEYMSVDDLQRLARVHLAKICQDHASKERGTRDPSGSASVITPDPQQDDTPVPLAIEDESDKGLVDLLEEMYEGSCAANDALERMGGAAETLSTELQQATLGIQARPKEFSPKNLRGTKRAINRGADAMDSFAQSVQHDMKVYSENSAKMFDATSRIAAMAGDFASDSEQQEAFRDASKEIGALVRAIQEAQATVNDLMAVVADTPKATTHLNRAKKSTLRALEYLIAEMAETMNGGIQAQKALEAYY